MPGKHFDLNFLKENTQDDPVLMAELIAIFLETTPAMIEEMERSYMAKDWNSLRKVAHKLKSNLYTLGIEELSQPIVKVERFAGEMVHIEEIGFIVEKIRRITHFASKELELELEMLKKH